MWKPAAAVRTAWILQQERRLLTLIARPLPTAAIRREFMPIKTWLNSKLNVGALGSYKIWLAQYAAAPTYNGRYDMWQYSSKGKIGGISGYTDLNISYLGY